MRRFLYRSPITSLEEVTLAALVLLTARAASAQAIIDVVGNYGDGRTRLLSRTANGAATFRVLNANGVVEASVTYGPFEGWSILTLAPSVNNTSRLLWSHVDGRVSLWVLRPDGTLVLERSREEGPFFDPAGQVLRAVDLAEDANRRWCLLLRDNSGAARVIVRDEMSGGKSSGGKFGPFAGWQPIAVAAGPADRTFRLLWRHINGAASLWRLGESGAFIDGKQHGPFAGWNPIDVSVGGDSNSRLLWRHESGAASVWVLNPAGAFVTGQQFGPFTGWTPRAISTGGDSLSRLLWNHTDTRASLWYLDPAAGFTGGAEFLP